MKSIGPFLNRDLGGFDRPRALFSGLPVGVDMLADYSILFEDFIDNVFSETFTDSNTDTVAVSRRMNAVLDSSATAALSADAENGIAVITSQATTDDSGGAIQLLNTTFLVKSGKKLWFEARVKVSDADQCDLFVGLANEIATNPEDVWATGHARAGFKIADGAASILCEVDNDTATTSEDSGVDAADDTYVRLGFRTDGASIRYYVNRALVKTLALPSAIAAVTMTPIISGLSGNDTGTHTRSIDYFLVAQER